MSLYDEKSVFNKIRGDDEKAFRWLFETFYPSLCLYASRFLNDEDHSAEVVQELFVKLWEKRKSLEVDVSVRPYLFRAVRNQCLNQIRYDKVKQLHAAKLQEALLSEDAAGDFFISPELMLKLEAGIESLPDKRREIFKMSREQGMKYREIADALGISVKTVENQMGSALRSLRELFRTFIFFILPLKKLPKE